MGYINLDRTSERHANQLEYGVSVSPLHFPHSQTRNKYKLSFEIHLISFSLLLLLFVILLFRSIALATEQRRRRRCRRHRRCSASGFAIPKLSISVSL